MLILALAMLAPMGPAAGSGLSPHAAQMMAAPMDHGAQSGAGGAEDGGMIAHLACAVICAGAPDPSIAHPSIGGPGPYRVLRQWVDFALPPGMALAPLRRPPKPSVA